MSGWVLACDTIADGWAAAILRASWQGGLALAGVWLLAAAVELGGRLGLRRPAELRSGPEVPSPLLIGLTRPAVMLPQALLSDGSRAELRGFLAHELAHVKRGDLWWNGLTSLAHGLFPFHPLVWLAGAE